MCARSEIHNAYCWESVKCVRKSHRVKFPSKHTNRCTIVGRNRKSHPQWYPIGEKNQSQFIDEMHINKFFIKRKLIHSSSYPLTIKRCMYYCITILVHYFFLNMHYKINKLTIKSFAMCPTEQTIFILSDVCFIMFLSIIIIFFTALNNYWAVCSLFFLFSFFLTFLTWAPQIKEKSDL